jgi:hypothetical protein
MKIQTATNKAELSSLPAQTKLMPLWYKAQVEQLVCSNETYAPQGGTEKSALAVKRSDKIFQIIDTNAIASGTFGKTQGIFRKT